MELEEQVVIGSRAKPGSVIHSTVPIHFLGSDEFVKQDGTDPLDFLRSKATGTWVCPSDREVRTT